LLSCHTVHSSSYNWPSYVHKYFINSPVASPVAKKKKNVKTERLSSLDVLEGPSTSQTSRLDKKATSQSTEQKTSTPIDLSNDPLAQFYAEALQAHRNGVCARSLRRTQTYQIYSTQIPDEDEEDIVDDKDTLKKWRPSVSRAIPISFNVSAYTRS
jgi:hypothetical protein